jgi:hypothetical protein
MKHKEHLVGTKWYWHLGYLYFRIKIQLNALHFQWVGIVDSIKERNWKQLRFQLKGISTRHRIHRAIKKNIPCGDFWEQEKARETRKKSIR